jgi:hypothetical protein
MYQQQVTVHYGDGATEAATLTQYELGQFEIWCRKQGLTPSRPGTAFMQDLPILGIRWCAWKAITRHLTAKTSFDAWDPTVIEVEVEDQQRVDPTQTATPDELSPE